MEPFKPAISINACAYARVSTLLDQDPENQLIHIRSFAACRGFSLVKEYVDRGISGVKERRPALDQLVADARRGTFKLLIVAALDRIGRNTRHLLNLVHELSSEYSVSIISLRENLDFSTSLGQATLTILSAISALDRENIRERIRCALAAKKLAAQKSGSGWRCGPPCKVNSTIVSQVLELKQGGCSIRAIEKAVNREISKTSIHRIIKGYRK